MKFLLLVIALVAIKTTNVSAASIDSRLSAREAYVGAPVTLQIMISDATDYDEPIFPSIDNCDVRPLGSPSQRSQITVINGRRTESRSVILQYQITPRREGNFTIPAIAFNVDGIMVSTKPEQFVATKSETGDLMFVEIEGEKKKVFVGQPVDMKLKIWLKPFYDPNSGRTLDEGDMWNMVSRSSSWGGFTAKITDMAENNQRPRGSEVFRNTSDGTNHKYYLYTINATVYPKRDGKIDASDLQIVFNYPTSIGQSRSPLGNMLDETRLNGKSIISQMMNDDFFGSHFGNHMAVTGSRPIAADVSVDATEVLPVPTTGRPADYRGAVGRYRIVTQATPAIVDAGDPITLNIGIAGTGPMELVQAPPLYELPELTSDFKVSHEPLAGFVQNETKVFSTTIRPRRDGITAIPGIRFSFFDPETEQFETVTSEPIGITVNKSEQLAVDAIVGNGLAINSGTTSSTMDSGQLDLTSHSDALVLTSQAPRTDRIWLPLFLFAPPLVCMAVAITKYRFWIVSRLPKFRSPKNRCLASIKQSPDSDAVDDALLKYLSVRFTLRHRGQLRKRASDLGQTLKDAATAATGELRIAGFYELASEVELYLTPGCNPSGTIRETDAQTEKRRRSAIRLVERIDAALQAKHRKSVRVPKAPLFKTQSITKTTAILFTAAMIGWPNGVSAACELSHDQRTTILVEAEAAYSQAVKKSDSESADAKELLATALEKYQFLVDSGVSNSNLFINLGNASLQLGKLGYAIANYEKALRIEPNNSQAKNNLAFTEKKISSTARSFQHQAGLCRMLPNSLRPITQWMAGITSVLFWGVLTLRLINVRFPVWKCAAAPLAMLLISGALLWSPWQSSQRYNAVIVTDDVCLYSGDGEQFDLVTTIDRAAGYRVERFMERGYWAHIRTPHGHTGWIRSRDLVPIVIP